MICFQNSFVFKSLDVIKMRNEKKLLATVHSVIEKNRVNLTQLNLSSKFEYDTVTMMKKNRQKFTHRLDDLILDLQSNEISNDFLKFCFLNRDTISYDLMYQITALKLKGEENETDITRVNKIKVLRKKILENIQLIDQPITQSLIVSEKLVRELLTQGDTTVVLNSFIKKNKINVSSLWIVLTAAISAWRNKTKLENDESSEIMLEKLINIKENIFSDKITLSLLAKEFILLDSHIFSTDSVQKIEIEIGVIDGLKLLMCLLEKLPKSSYGILLDEVWCFYNYLVISKLGIKKRSLGENMIQFSPKSITTDSRLVNIKDKNLQN
jgi:hypothetical protein